MTTFCENVGEYSAFVKTDNLFVRLMTVNFSRNTLHRGDVS